MFKKVRLQITSLTVAIVMCLYVATSLSIYGLVHRIVIQNVDQSTAKMLRTYAGQPQRLLTQLPTGTYIFYKPPHEAMKSNAPTEVQTKVEKFVVTRTLKRHWVALWNVPNPNRIFRVSYQPLPENSSTHTGYLLMAVDVTKEMEVLYQLARSLFYVGIVGFCAATGLGFLLAARSLSPIRKAYDRQLQFVSDASHEMRTPLAVIQANLGVVLEHTNESVLENLEWINNAHAESRRLTKLVHDLLTLARGDAGRAPLSIRELNLSELSQTTLHLFQPIADANQIELMNCIQPSVQVSGDEDRLKQLLVILLDNALKFTPQSGSVTLSLRTDRAHALLSVSDTGIGIEKTDLARVFSRFYQGDTTRSRHTSHGSGLGLSIAKWIVEAHRGKISLTSKRHQGTTVEVKLPLR